MLRVVAKFYEVYYDPMSRDARASLLTRIFHTKSIMACGKLYGYCVGLEW